MEYIELEIEVSPGEDGRFDVRVQSSEGEGKGHMVLPFTLGDLVGVVHGVHPFPAPTGEAPPPAPPGRARELGRQLFEALFNNEARDILNRTLSRADAAGDPGQTGVRIRLSMDLRDPGVCEVAALPWELMCPDGGSPLAISQRTPVVRAVDTPLPTEPRPRQGALRILALKSNPEGTAKLDLQQEVDAVEVSWAQLPGVQVDFVAPTQNAILDALATNAYDVIHYMGHGGFDPESTGGRLLLEDDSGALRRVPAEDFADWVAPHRPRLVFLNACETGRPPGRAEVPPFAGVAAALIRAGVPAVIGNQFSVSDAGAITFAKKFYARVVEGQPVDAAAAMARMAIYDSVVPVQWATPVLYMRCRTGDLFPRAAPAPQSPPPQPEPVRTMSDTPTRGGISIGGSVTGGGVFTVGDQNVVTSTVTTQALPPADQVDIAAVMQQIRALIAEAASPADAKPVAKANNALGAADIEISSDAPDKESVATSIAGAVEVMKQTNSFAEQAKKLAPLLIQAAGWVGATAAPIIIKAMAGF